MANLTTSLVTDSVVILEWTLPPLANIPDSIKPQTPESQFDVIGYSISILNLPNIDPVYLEGRDNTSYLFSNENGLSPELDRITISLRVNYSLAEINDNIPGVSNLSVDIPSPDGKMLIHNVTTMCVLCTLSSNTSPVISPVPISLLYIQTQVPSLTLLRHLQLLPM